MLGFGIQLRMGHPGKNVEPVIDGDQDDPLAGKGFPVKVSRMAIAGHKGPAVNPEDHRQLFLPALGRRPNVEIQAVLIHGLLHRIKLLGIEARHGRLRAPGAGPGAVPHPVPVGRGLRGPPTQLSHRRRGIGNAIIGGNAGPAAGYAAYRPVFHHSLSHKKRSFLSWSEGTFPRSILPYRFIKRCSMIKSRSIFFITGALPSTICSTPARVPMLRIRAACRQQVQMIAFSAQLTRPGQRRQRPHSCPQRQDRCLPSSCR